MRNSGLSSHRPTPTSPTSEATPTSTDSQREPCSASGAAGAMKATTASSGTISRSSNSSTDTIFWPGGSAMSPRSPSSCMTMAVEVSTKPAAPTNATCHG